MDEVDATETGQGLATRHMTREWSKAMDSGDTAECRGSRHTAPAWEAGSTLSVREYTSTHKIHVPQDMT